MSKGESRGKVLNKGTFLGDSEENPLPWDQWTWATCDKFEQSELADVKRMWFKAKNGRITEAYGARFIGGGIVRLRRVSEILDMFAKPKLRQYAADQSAKVYTSQIQENRAYTQREIWDMENFARSNWKGHRDQAANFGKQAHEWIEAFLKRGRWPSPEEMDLVPLEVANSLELWAEWWNSNGFEALAVEIYVCFAELAFGGTVDLVCRDKTGKIWIIDWKTSKGMYSTHLYQVAAYFAAARKCGYEAERVAILRIGKHDGFPHWRQATMEELKLGWKLFKRMARSIHDLKELDNLFYKEGEKFKKDAAIKLEAERIRRQNLYNQKSEADQAVSAYFAGQGVRP